MSARAPLLRPLLFGLLALGLIGTTAELLLLEHYEGPWQLIPFIVISLVALSMVWHLVSRSGASVVGIRIAMTLLLVTGLAGVLLHFRGNMEFQLEVDPSAHGWALVRKILRAKAPPALAPAALSQLALLGLVYAYRHPVLSEAGPAGPAESKDLSTEEV